jgi:thiol-disulfide isomerase/thioredoxin
MSLRKDTEFWKKFSYEMAPDELKQKLKVWEKRMPGKRDNGNFWNSASWFVVASAQEKINKGEKIIVEFWAPWCGPCRMMKPKFEKVVETKISSKNLKKGFIFL